MQPSLSFPRLALLAGATAIIAVSCQPIVACGCTPAIPTAILHGVVTGPEGAPVAGAQVRAVHAAADCLTDEVEIGGAASAPDGGYIAFLHLSRYVPGECLEAWAEPPAGSTLHPSEPTRFAAHFRISGELDSVRVDLQLRAP